MEQTVTEAEGYQLIKLSGRLDTAGVSRGETRFSAVAAQAGGRVVIDISEVSFLASLGVRMFITTARTLAAKNGRMALFAPTEAVADVIETTAMDDIVSVTQTLDEAVALVRR